MKINRPAISSRLTLVRPLPPRGALRWLALIAAFALPFAGSLHADAPPTIVRIAPAGVDVEGLKNFGLQWNAVPNATYLLERAGTLAPGSPWHSLDAVKPTDVVGNYQFAVPATDTSGFYRLVLPKPAISSVEPAVFPTGATTTLYLVGQCFESNDVVRVDGIDVGGVVFVNSGLLRITLPPQSAGTHLVELVRAGVVTASFTVTCADAFSNPEVVLQGPPEVPLARLLALWASRKGYQYYRAQSELNSARLNNNPAFQDHKHQGVMQRAAFLSKKGYDYYQANSGLARSKQSEVKANLKAAYNRSLPGGSDDDCDDENSPSSLTAAQCNYFAVDNKIRICHRTSSARNPYTIIRTNSAGCAVMPFSGEVRQCDIDLLTPGRGLDFVWGRTYNSRIGRTGASANGWTFSYDVNIQPVGGGIVIRNGTGRADTFKPNAGGVYTCPEFFSEGMLVNNVFKLTFADTGYWEFKPLTASPDAGKLAKIVDCNGNTIVLNYDASGRLAEVVDDLGRTNTVAYNSAGQLASITDFSGRTVTYQYYQGLRGEPGGAGDLKSVTSPPVTGTPNGNDFPAGKTVTYTYSAGYADNRENHLLLSVIDAKGQIQHRYVYQHNQTNLEFLRCVSVQHWTNTPTMISYLPQTATPANQFATLRCVISNPVGDVTECYFDARNRGVKLQEFTGRATPGVQVTATTNRPVGKVRPSDPDVYETRWSWNNDSLCTLEVGPNGQQLQCVYQSDFEPATRARKRADCRVVRERASSPVDSDGDGTADLTERVWYYDYDPRFGSDPSASRGKKLYVGNLPYSASARGPRQTTDLSGSYNPSGNSRAKVITDRDSGRSKGFGFIKDEQGQERCVIEVGREDARLESRCFITSATDPRGNVTTGTYDAAGNRVKVQFHWDRNSSAEDDFAYDSHGQLTAITHAPDANGYRRVDTFSYFSSGPQTGYLQSCTVDSAGLALRETYEYDARGNVTRCIDPRGNDWLCTYNSLDQLVQTESATLGGGSTGTYRIKTQCAFDANDKLTLVAVENRDAAGTPGKNAFWRTQFIYDDGQRLTGCWRDKSGALVLRCTEVAYNAADQVVLYRSPEAVNGNDASNTMAFAYDERGMSYRTIAAPGSALQSTTQRDYDANGNVTRVSAGLEGTPSITMMEYDEFAGFGSSSRQIAGCTAGHAGHVGEYIASNDPASDQIAGGARSTSFSVAAITTVQTRISKITDPMGNVTTFHYDANDNLKVIRDFGQLNDVPGSAGNIRLAESRYQYDGLNRPVRSRDSFFSLTSQANIGDGERTTTFAYAPNSECISITDDLGRATTFAYDTACRPSSVSSPGGKSVIAVIRDQAGNVTQTTQTDQPDLGGPPQVFSWTCIFDERNRCVSTTDNVGNSHLFAYDSRDNCVRTTDPKGNETVYGYDGLSRTVNFNVAQGPASSGIFLGSGQFDYDDNDRCISRTDANGNVTLHAYDSLDRPTQTTQADGTHSSLVWSPRSNLIQETDANGTVMQHTYDLNDRCISNNITPGAGVAATTTFETFAYDGASRLVSANNDGSQNAFEYDSLGNCTRGVSGGVGAVVSPHDSVGRRTSLTYPGGRVLTYAYDALDQCTNIAETGASLASFSYAGPGRVARVIRGNGTRTQVTYDGIAGTPNAFEDFGHGQIRSVTHGIPGAGGPQSFAAVSLKWDRNGNKTLRTDTTFAPAIPRTNNLGLQYDATDRLTRATVIGDVTILRDTIYGFDLMGNRTNVTGAASCSGAYVMDGLAPGPMDFQMNQYTATPCDARTYDDNGNLVTRGSAAGPVTYQYDYDDRLVQVQSVDFSSGAAVIFTSTYAYDALGRRVSKSVSSGGLPPVTTEFLYDGNRVIEERESGVVGASFVLDGSRSYDDGVIQMRRGGQDFYYHTDDQGNVLALSGANGAVVERYDYDDYGAVTFLTSDGLAIGATSSAVGNVYCWGGLRLDSETGLHNNDGSGFHEPQSGRVITVPWIPNNPSIPHPTSARNNPWSGGDGSRMKKGTVKFFNEAKGFGFTRLLESIQDESKGFSSLIR